MNGKSRILVTVPDYWKAAIVRGQTCSILSGLLFFIAIWNVEASAVSVSLTNQHADVRIIYQSNETNNLSIVVRDGDSGRTFQSNEVILVVAETARVQLPSGTPFGEEGQDLWVLPQSQDNNLLYLGFSAEGVPPAVFGGSIELALRKVEGPGHFFAWQAGEFGALAVNMNSADGISNLDLVTPIPGSHEHSNWGFSTSGVYRVTFQASGQRQGETTNVISLETTFTFHVLPLPAEVERPFTQWQKLQWPTGAPENVQGPGADPDGDGVVNLAEYAFGSNPIVPATNGLPEVSIVTSSGFQYGSLRYTRSKAATDLIYHVEVSGSVTGPWSELNALPEVEDRMTLEVVRIQDTIPIDQASQRFYRLRISLKP